MDDRALTEELLGAAGLPVHGAELDALFGCRPALTEWSLNATADPRGALRVSVWTKDRGAAAAVVEKLQPRFGATREALVGDDFEGMGLSVRGGPSSFRWWTLADDGEALAEKARRTWGDIGDVIDGLLAAAGGPYTCAALGVEIAALSTPGVPQRRTIYAELRSPASALRVLEHAKIVVSQPANLFWKGIVGLEPGGRPWPRVWAARSVGAGGGWKFYYFARGDDLRRTDAVLLDAASASPPSRAVWTRLCETASQPCVQLIGLTLPDVGSPSFTIYLSRI